MRAPSRSSKVKNPAKNKCVSLGADTITKSKYHAEGSWEGKEFFSSKKELKRYRELQLLEKIGEIKDLKRQVRHKLVVNGQLIATYVSDNEFTVVATGEHVVEDVKSPITKKIPAYRMKKKLMLALHKINIVET